MMAVAPEATPAPNTIIAAQVQQSPPQIHQPSPLPVDDPYSGIPSVHKRSNKRPGAKWDAQALMAMFLRREAGEGWETIEPDYPGRSRHAMQQQYSMIKKQRMKEEGTWISGRRGRKKRNDPKTTWVNSTTGSMNSGSHYPSRHMGDRPNYIDNFDMDDHTSTPSDHQDNFDDDDDDDTNGDLMDDEVASTRLEAPSRSMTDSSYPPTANSFVPVNSPLAPMPSATPAPQVNGHKRRRLSPDAPPRLNSIISSANGAGHMSLPGSPPHGLSSMNDMVAQLSKTAADLATHEQQMNAAHAEDIRRLQAAMHESNSRFIARANEAADSLRNERLSSNDMIAQIRGQHKHEIQELNAKIARLSNVEFLERRALEAEDKARNLHRELAGASAELARVRAEAAAELEKAHRDTTEHKSAVTSLQAELSRLQDEVSRKPSVATSAIDANPIPPNLITEALDLWSDSSAKIGRAFLEVWRNATEISRHVNYLVETRDDMTKKQENEALVKIREVGQALKWHADEVDVARREGNEVRQRKEAAWYDFVNKTPKTKIMESKVARETVEKPAEKAPEKPTEYTSLPIKNFMNGPMEGPKDPVEPRRLFSDFRTQVPMDLTNGTQKREAAPTTNGHVETRGTPPAEGTVVVSEPSPAMEVDR